MTWELLLWVFSMAGALVFFAAGRLTVRRAAVSAAVPSPAPELRPPASVVAVPAPAPAPAPPPLPDTRERDALRLDVQRLQRELAADRGELGRLTEKKSQADSEAERLRAALAAAERQNLTVQRQTTSLEEQLRMQAAAAKRDGDLLAQEIQKRRETEALLEGKRQELLRWQERVDATEAQLQGAKLRLQGMVNPEVEQTLRQDLAIKTDQLATRSQAMRRLENENAILSHQNASLSALATEVEWLRAENGSLRAQSFAARPAPRGNPLALGGATDGLSRGSVLQTLVQRVSRLGDVRCAVVADDLGLVVASHGELGEEVAAVGALFGRAGQQAQQVLPLQNVERVTVEDNLGVVLAIRPLRTDHPDQPDLTLITLAVGAAPDQRLLNKLIAEGPRLALIP